MSTTFLGVDLSLTATGLAVWHDNHLLTYTLSSDSKLPGDDPARWDQILNQIWPHVDGHDNDVITTIEGLFPTMKVDGGKAHDNLLALRSVLVHGLRTRGTQYAIVHPGTLKKYATGSGNAGGGKSAEQKQKVLDSVKRRYGHLVTVANHNEADALTLLAMTLHHYGRPLSSAVDIGDGCVEALDVPAWPSIIDPKYVQELRV